MTLRTQLTSPPTLKLNKTCNNAKENEGKQNTSIELKRKQEKSKENVPKYSFIIGLPPK